MSPRDRVSDDEILAALRAHPACPPGLARDIMRRIAADRPRRHPRPAHNSWWVVTICGAAAAIVLLSWVTASLFDAHPTESHREAAIARNIMTLESVRFALRAEDAQSVAVVGDFNNWNPQATPLNRGPGGEWALDLALRPGRYTYAFLVDGQSWQPDPRAPIAADADFGRPGSVLLVGTGL